MGEAYNILLVDDDVTIIAQLNRILTGIAELRFARSGEEAIRLARLNRPDLLLLDIELPDMTGFQVLESFQSYPLLADIPIIFITGNGQTEMEVRSLEMGAVDFISKPLHPLVVGARVRTQLRIKQMTDALRQAAGTDDLTGIANRRQFNERLTVEWKRTLRMGTPLSLLLIDVDHFKAYNDLYGHPLGDQCLRRVAQAMRTVLKRPADLLARYGGEEFALLLPDTDERGAEQLADQLLSIIRSQHIPHRGAMFGEVSISVGVSTLPRSIPDSTQAPEMRRQTVSHTFYEAALVQSADTALYSSKKQGRNCKTLSTLYPPSAQTSADESTSIQVLSPQPVSRNHSSQ